MNYDNTAFNMRASDFGDGGKRLDASKPGDPLAIIHVNRTYAIMNPLKSLPPAWAMLLLVAALNAPLTVRSAPEDIPGKGRRLAELLAREDFAGAVAQFDDTMKTALPEPALRETWQTFKTQAGQFQKPLGVRQITSGGYDVALVTCQFARSAWDLKVVFDADGRVAGLFFLASQGFVSDLPSYATTNAFQETEFTVGQGKWPLPGTLTWPRHDGGAGPAVVLVHGSGPEDRDETGGANKPFRDLAWGLASQGIAVLRYENRTKEYAARFREKFPSHFTVREETTDDALSAVAQLRRTKGIDPKRIFVLGHSWGGLLAPKIGQADTNIAGLILLAGATRSTEDMMVEQTRYLISVNGTPSAADEAYLAGVQSAAAKVKQLTAADVSSSAIIFGAQPVYWLDLRGYDPLATAKGLNQPLLILQGGRDYQVTQVDFGRWQAALASRPGVTFKSYPALNHQFITGEGKSTPAEYEQAGHVAEPVVADIAEWIKSH
jgi:hypothetical protein